MQCTNNNRWKRATSVSTDCFIKAAFGGGEPQWRMFRKQSHLLRANGRGIGKESTTPKGVALSLASLPVVASYRRQPRAIESITAMR